VESKPHVPQAQFSARTFIKRQLVAATWLLLSCAGSSASVPAQPLTPASNDPERAAPSAHCEPAQISALRFGLLVLGSGGGPRSLGRAGSSYIVVVEGKPRVLIDAGPGTFLRLGEMEVDLRALDIVLLTHLHVDHAGDLPGFILARAVTGEGPMTFRITGPAGSGSYPSTTEFVARLFGDRGAFAYVPTFTQSHLQFSVTDLPTSTASDARLVIENIIIEKDVLNVSAVAVDHRDVPAMAYRIEHAGSALVITGDLASRNDNLIALAAGSDLLVYDTAVMDPPGSAEALYELHTTPKRIGEVATQARVKSLLLSHLTGRVVDHADEVLHSVQTGFKGETRFAHDCMTLELETP
jgi:ribonuclease BN (tRNA processing enzyme)